ncbi:hypothetical protein Tco_1375107, partial [Tanacetum coccineum]
IMGEPLSPDRVFDFPMNEPHPAYDFFAPAPLPEYAGNPNNNNGWLAADDYLLGELEAMVNEQMVVPAIEEVTEPVVEAEEEQVIAPVVDMEEDLAALFGDDDFEDDASDGFDMEEAEGSVALSGAGLADIYAAERHADLAAVDYSLEDEQPGEFTNAMYFGIR